MSKETVDIAVAEKVDSSKIRRGNTNVNPSLKGGAFLVGTTSPESIFVSEEWTEEQRMIAQTVIDFCVKEIQDAFFKRGRELEITKPEDKLEMLDLVKKAGELGLCGVSIPEAYGGLGLDFNTGTYFSEAIAAGFSFATTIGAQTSIGSLPIVFYGNEAQKQKYLPGIASGELIASYALTEPTAGSDANAGKTKATLTEDGKLYLLNGQKIWITNGGFASVFVVFAKIGDDEDLSTFIVEKDFEGLTIGAEEKKMGIKGSSTVQLFFDNCKVPVENLLGERQGGFRMALNILNTGRIKLGAGGVGGAKFTVDRCVKFAKERKQFDQVIADFGVIKHKIGDITTKAFAIESAVYRTGYNVDLKSEQFLAEGLSEGDAKLNGVREFAVECSILKTKGSELACYATDEGIQIHGGMGYATETGMEMAYRDARITKIYEGTNEVNRMLSVGELTKRGLQTKEIDLIGAGKKVPGFIFSQFMPFKSKAGYAAEERFVKGLKNLFLLISGAVGKKLGKKMIEEQEIILNLSDILAEVYICESVLLKIQKLEKKTGIDAEKLGVQKEMMRLYLYDAHGIASKAARDAVNSFSEGLQRKILLSLIRRMLNQVEINPKEIRRKVAEMVYKNGGYCF
ncbi:acyl-CoA dehydrogenase family protein [Saprospiraceae bacterium]|jgi:alkylation response protein AidB-like acyl-CoA dehydrogenase|nr:acyl-CoA dehydrogenase family protein [Bacteroidota bacterium]MDB4727221.1 acyl-CoA dehydrogenase family protein [Saprospiraceae bacterium]MDF1865039.1 acyl-CoA dehydrogenase family protein [Saprospiraceae bacterium]